MQRHLFWLVAAGLLLAGCADPARNLYNGIQIHNDSMRSPQQRADSPAPNYDEYKKERDKIINGDSGGSSQ